MTTTAFRSRHPKGISTGGQFAAEHKAEPTDVALAAATQHSVPISEMIDDSTELEHDNPNLNNVYVTEGKGGVNLVTEHFRDFADCAPEDADDPAEYVAERWDAVQNFLSRRHPNMSIIEITEDHIQFGFGTRVPADTPTEEALRRLAEDSCIEEFHQDFSDEDGPGPADLRRFLADYDKAVASGIPEQVAVQGFSVPLPLGDGESPKELEGLSAYTASGGGPLLIVNGEDSAELDASEMLGWEHENLTQSLQTHWTEEQILNAGDRSTHEQIVDMYGEDHLDDEDVLEHLDADEERSSENDLRLHTLLGRERYEALRLKLDPLYNPKDYL